MELVHDMGDRGKSFVCIATRWVSMHRSGRVHGDTLGVSPSRYVPRMGNVRRCREQDGANAPRIFNSRSARSSLSKSVSKSELMHRKPKVTVIKPQTTYLSLRSK